MSAQVSSSAAAGGFSRPGLGGLRSGRSAPVVRLTRRGRSVLLVGFLVVALAGLTWFSAGSAATSETADGPQTVSVEVTAGDTLWELASAVADPGQTQRMVHRIMELNALGSSDLSIGQELAIPVPD